MFLRGFPSKTLESQEFLEGIARRIKQVSLLRDLVLSTSAGDLLKALEHEPVGREAVEDIRRYLQQYGHQVYNLDFVQPTQVENPLPVLLALRSLVASDGQDTSARQEALVRDRDTRIEETLSSLGPVRRRLFRLFLRWAQTYGPYREEALFYMGAAWPVLRRLVLEVGERLVSVGTLGSADDAFYLETTELADACRARLENRTCPELFEKASQRRQLREARKRLHPPGILPEGSRWKVGPIDFAAFETQKAKYK